jgi:4-hydroxy-2-oxoheptanedioate aldolase
LRTNRTKAKILSGQVAFGANPDIDHPAMVELIGHMGYDWVFLDAEHGSWTVADIAEGVRAAETVGLTAVVRVPHNSPHVILRYLDQGAHGIIVPHVNTREDAEAAVQATRYGPVGRRGFGGLKAHEYQVSGSWADRIASANRETLLIGLIEEEAAVTNLEALLSVGEIDAWLIGAMDLAQSMGHPGQPQHPDVAKAVDHVLSTVVRAGKPVGSPATAETVGPLLEKGALLITTHVIQYLTAGMKHFMEVAERSADPQAG